MGGVSGVCCEGGQQLCPASGPIAGGAHRLLAMLLMVGSQHGWVGRDLKAHPVSPWAACLHHTELLGAHPWRWAASGLH